MNFLFGKLFVTPFIFFIGMSGVVFAGESEVLDPPYSHLVHPTDDKQNNSRIFAVGRSNTLAVVSFQTEVKAQQNRGTCSIFSATAVLESLLNIGQSEVGRTLPDSLDLSEEWLEYVVMSHSASEGSTTPRNAEMLLQFGSIYESDLPYIGTTWKKLGDGDSTRVCGHLNTGFQLDACLLGHRDPFFLKATEKQLTSSSSPYYDPGFFNLRESALMFRSSYFPKLSVRSLTKTSQIKQSLLNGVPVVLDIDFYYGAWNHRKATDFGLIRNTDYWNAGVVTYPEEGSKDVQVSLKEPAGHSVVIVGYDDSIVIKNKVQMLDGSIKEVSYQGVYYFKNSWGTDGFGKAFQAEGRGLPGYGMITQKYAHQYGGFFQLGL